MKRFAKFALVAAAGIGATAAHAVVIVSNTTQNNVFAVSNTDLLQTSLATIQSTGTFSREGEQGLLALNNGQFGALGSVITGNPGLGAATADGSNSITYTLTGPMNVMRINSYAGWDAFRGGQSYTVSFAYDGAPTTFVPIATVFNNATGGGNINTLASISRSAGYLGAGVVAVKFDFGSDLQFGYAGYRELDVLGAAVPEPASWVLLLAGFAMVGLSVRRRKTVAA